MVGYFNAGDRMMYWGWERSGAACFWVPGVGPLVVAGPLASWIIGALEGAAVVGGLSALGAGLCSIGIPKDSIISYETAIRADKFLVIAHGTPDEVQSSQRDPGRYPRGTNVRPHDVYGNGGGVTRS